MSTPNVGDTQGASSGAVSGIPGGIALNTIAAGPLGAVFKALVIIRLSGTAEPQLTNLALCQFSGAGRITKLLLPTTPGDPSRIEVDRVTIAPSTSLAICTINDMTAGAIYSMTLIATRLQ